MNIIVIIIGLSIFLIILHKKIYKSEKEISLDNKIPSEDYEEIKKYISETYNLDIKTIFFTLLEISDNKNLIRFEIQLKKEEQGKIQFYEEIKEDINLYISEKEFELKNKYHAKFFTYFSSFEHEELERIYDKLPSDLNFLKKNIKNENIWIIKNVFFTRVVVFFYSDSQLPEKCEKDRISKIVKEYIYTSLKKFDTNNILKLDEIKIEFDTKENFDSNFESNWYYYML